MAFNFDAPTNRIGTDSIRWDSFDSKEVLPLWVADMDFKSPPCVIEALSNRVQQGIYGYTHSPSQMNAMIAGYLQEHNKQRPPQLRGEQQDQSQCAIEAELQGHWVGGWRGSHGKADIAADASKQR